MMDRICNEVQRQLPGVVAGTLPRWRARLVALHLRRCEACTAALAEEEALQATLESLGPAGEEGEPPDGLLDALLEQAEHPGARGRAAVPARGAVSGARPWLSAAFLFVGAAAGTAAGYAGWRGARAVRRRVSRRDVER